MLPSMIHGSFFQMKAPHYLPLPSCYSTQTKGFYAPTLLLTLDVPLANSRTLLSHHILFHLALFDSQPSAHGIKIDLPNNLKPVHSHYWAHYYKGLLPPLIPNQVYPVSQVHPVPQVHPVSHLPTVLGHSLPSRQPLLPG